MKGLALATAAGCSKQALTAAWPGLTTPCWDAGSSPPRLEFLWPPVRFAAIFVLLHEAMGCAARRDGSPWRLAVVALLLTALLHASGAAASRQHVVGERLTLSGRLHTLTAAGPKGRGPVRVP